jgi:glycosyltransferase involved in cell wall biosynthesis
MLSNMWPPEVAGGAERYAARLADELVALGHEVGVVTFGVEGERVLATVDDHGFDKARWWEASALSRRRFHIVDLWNREARAVIGRTVRSFEPDVVHTHAVSGMSIAALLTDAPRVHHVHDFWLLCQMAYPIRAGVRCASTCASCRPYKVTRRLALSRRPPRFIAPSAAIQRAHIDAGYDPRHWQVIRHPVTAPLAGVHRSGDHTGKLRLGFIGRLTRDKGFDLLLASLDDLPDARLITAGHGDLATAAAAHHAVEHRGVVAGEEKERFFADIDVLVVPSRMDEIAGLVIDEAAVRGVPVIASRRGGIPEYVPPGCHPLLFEPDEPDALVSAVQRFASEPAAYPSTAPTGHTWPVHTERVLEVYRRAVAEQGER